MGKHVVTAEKPSRGENAGSAETNPTGGGGPAVTVVRQTLVGNYLSGRSPSRGKLVEKLSRASV